METQEPVTTRFASDILRKLDHKVRQLQRERPGARVSRGTVVREIVARVLLEEEAETEKQQDATP